MHDPSFSHSRPRRGCFCGTFRPSRRQIRSTRAAAIRAIRADAAQQSITILTLSLTDSLATVYYNNGNYYSEVEALDRLTRVLMKDAPASVEHFRMIPTASGVPQREFNVLRTPQERSYSQESQLNFFGSDVTMDAPPLSNPVLRQSERGSYPRFDWDIFPQVREELFDPDNPLALQILLGVGATVELAPGWSISAEAEGSIWDNFNIGRPSDSTLPHVRSDFLRYFVQGRTGIGYLSTAYRFRVAPTVYATLKAGYLESMFAGVGGEILWRPEGQRWALGADLYEVQQRDFDRLVGLQNYRILTGHISVYYASPWYDLNFMFSAGKYLAGDRGVTFQVTRRFATGVEIGAFMTKTNVSAAQFGEGSFDKGIIIRIPIGWTVPLNTQLRLAMDIRPTQRDGGQRLSADATLYDETERTSMSEMLLQGAK